MGRFHGAAESVARVTEPKLELNSGGVAGVAKKGCLCNGAAGAAGKGRYVGVPTTMLTVINDILCLLVQSVYTISAKNLSVPNNFLITKVFSTFKSTVTSTKAPSFLQILELPSSGPEYSTLATGVLFLWITRF
jgi:hypothetical protein